MSDKGGCPECLTESYGRDGAPLGVFAGFVAHELPPGGKQGDANPYAHPLVVWRPCMTCNPERYDAWAAGEMAGKHRVHGQPKKPRGKP